MDLFIIILNYRTPKETVDCLHSLYGQIQSTTNRVVVVDNFSNDHSVETISRAIKDNHWESWASLKALNENKGYAAGNNSAIRDALDMPHPPRYIHILNPDTIVYPGAIKTLIKFMDEHPRASIAGSRLENLDGSPQFAAFRFPTVFSEFDSAVRVGFVSRLLKKWNVVLDIQNEPYLADWVAGASFMVRSELFKQIGLFDEKYFLYYEEVDLCMRSQKAGWECWYVPASRVVHLVGKSTGIDSADKSPKRRPAYWFNSRRRYFQKNYGIFQAVAIDAFWMFGFALWRLRRLIQRKPDTDPPYMLYDFFRYSSLISFYN